MMAAARRNMAAVAVRDARVRECERAEEPRAERRGFFDVRDVTFADRFRHGMGGRTKMTTATTTTTTMYPLRPAVTLPATYPSSSSVYKMRNIHDRHDDQRGRHDAADIAEAKMPDADVVTQAPVQEYEALEARQEKILDQLAELKKQVSTLCYIVKQSSQVELTIVPNHVEPVVTELVLNANPRKPPYSILALQKLWKDTSIRVTSNIHSSVSNDQISIVFPKIPKSNNTSKIINLMLIWKDVPNMEFIMTDSCRIIGEANFLRYMSRLIESHNYETTSFQPHTVDFALDLAYVLYNEKCIDKGLLRLADSFEKWSCKDGFNIGDIAVWSLIKQFPRALLPPTLHKWYKSCEKAFIDETSIH